MEAKEKEEKKEDYLYNFDNPDKETFVSPEGFLFPRKKLTFKNVFLGPLLVVSSFIFVFFVATPFYHWLHGVNNIGRSVPVVNVPAPSPINLTGKNLVAPAPGKTPSVSLPSAITSTNITSPSLVAASVVEDPEPPTAMLALKKIPPPEPAVSVSDKETMNLPVQQIETESAVESRVPTEIVPVALGPTVIDDTVPTVITITSPQSFANLGKAKAAGNVGKLMRINGIKNPRRLQIGTVLKIPVDPTNPDSGTVDYKVKKGDCPWTIAMQAWSGSTSSLSIASVSGNVSATP